MGGLPPPETLRVCESKKLRGDNLARSKGSVNQYFQSRRFSDLREVATRATGVIDSGGGLLSIPTLDHNTDTLTGKWFLQIQWKYRQQMAEKIRRLGY